MTIFLRLREGENHHGIAPEILVHPAGGSVVLCLDPLPGETYDDRYVTRYLRPTEARELASMLWHHADELERSAR